MNENLQKKIVKKIDKIAKQYESMEVARTLIHLIPYGIGSAMDSYLVNQASKIHLKRLEKLVKELKISIVQLKKDKIDWNYLRSEEFYFFWRNLFTKVVQTRDIDKILLYRNIFIVGISLEKPASYTLDTIMEIINNLELQDILLLRYLKTVKFLDLEEIQHIYDKNEPQSKSKIKKIENIAKSIGFESVDLLNVSTLKLRNHGLLRTHVIGVGLGTPIKGDIYSLSTFGEKFISAVIEPLLLQHIKEN